MNKNTLLIIGGIAIIAVLLLGKIVLPNNSTTSKEVGSPLNIVDNVKQQEETSLKADENANWYTAYSAETLKAAISNNQKPVIFFHASWCPTCKTASEDFQANINQIPSDVTILKADYDIERELKEKYGVVMQDTFVQVDSNGKEIAKWNSGGEGINTLLANLK